MRGYKAIESINVYNVNYTTLTTGASTSAILVNAIETK